MTTVVHRARGFDPCERETRKIVGLDPPIDVVAAMDRRSPQRRATASLLDEQVTDEHTTDEQVTDEQVTDEHVDGPWEPSAPRPLRSGGLLPGTRWVLRRWLGAGGMGEVFEVEHAELRRRCAVKLLNDRVARHPRAVRAFFDEGRAATRAGSPYIAEVFDLATLADGRPFIVMELVEGRSITSLLEPGRCSLEQVLAIMRQAAKGLQAAHDAGVIHRDIKPENLLLTRSADGRRDMVKIVDFGIATIIEDRPHAHGNQLAGTPCYMAPEVLLSLPYDGRADQYALACMAYELLAGRPPFDQPSVVEIHQAHLEQQSPPPLRELVPKLPAELEAVIMRALHRDPDARYPNLAELEAALCEAQLQAGVETAWDDLPPPEVHPDRRARILAGFGAREPEHHLQRALRRRAVRAAIASSLMLGVMTAAAAGWWWPEPGSGESLARIEELESEARRLAEAAAFVYPTPAHADRTAFVALLELEALEGPRHEQARARAAVLRDELATTLTSLGDRYWELEGGQPFAREFYAQALLFDPEREPPLSRATLTVLGHQRLEEQAAALSFSDGELLALEPLVVLSHPDHETALWGLSQWAGGDPPVALSTLGHVETLLGAAEGPVEELPSGTSSEPSDGAAEPVAMVEAVVRPTPNASGREGARNLSRRRHEARRGEASAARLAARGRRALALRRLEDAARLFRAALIYDRRDAGSLAGLAQVSFERGAYTEAVRWAARAVKAEPDAAKHRLALGDAYLKVGRHAHARDEYEHALQLGARRARERLVHLDALLAKG
jgi:tetratricopeptide (TPR) repeat protein